MSSLVISSSAFAAPPSQTHNYRHHAFSSHHLAKSPNHFEVIGAIGPANLNARNSQLGVTSSETDKLVRSNTNNWTSFAGQLGVGYVNYFRNAQQYSEKTQWFPSIEPQVNFYPLISNTLNGDVWRFNSSAFNDLSYHMPIRSMRLMFDAALTIVSKKQNSLYAIAGIGPAWSRVSYNDSDNDTGVPCPDQRLKLNANTSARFAWEVGAGIIHAVNKRVGISVEYLYADLGKVSFSSGGNTGTITAPVISPSKFKLTAQTVFLGLHVALN
ncbi:MAG: outer membrane beta-barrel protein [Gammaproteobacteria bacterium]|nr:outer membrane beta-barrel protein [Gammaproteobacteria bacterium]